MTSGLGNGAGLFLQPRSLHGTGPSCISQQLYLSVSHTTPCCCTLLEQPGLLPVSAASSSTDHEHGTVCQPILEHQIRPSAPSSVISRPTCFNSSLRCCWQVGSAPFVRRRFDCSATFGAVYRYSDLLTYLLAAHAQLLVLTMCAL